MSLLSIFLPLMKILFNIVDILNITKTKLNLNSELDINKTKIKNLIIVIIKKDLDIINLYVIF